MVVHAIVKGVRLMVDVTTPRPVIAITFPDEGYTMMRLFTRLAVWLAGGKPVLVHPSDPQFDMIIMIEATIVANIRGPMLACFKTVSLVKRSVL